MHEGQEIGTHTFSHYYCLEEGQTLAQFEADLAAAIQIAEAKGISLKSLVFPRNQWNAEYLSTLRKLGVRCYRGNPPGWIHRASEDARNNAMQRALRLIDAYCNLSGHNTHDFNEYTREKPYNFPASRFLRPCRHGFAALEPLRLRRITRAMDHAARHHRFFHLWWHPHNFGIDTERNIHFLERILEHYQRLRKKHGMTSLNMGELCALAEASHGE